MQELRDSTRLAKNGLAPQTIRPSLSQISPGLGLSSFAQIQTQLDTAIAPIQES